MINHAIICGRLVAEPEERNTKTKKRVASFTVAVNRTSETADFIPVVAFDPIAEVIIKHCHRGDKITVSGSLTIRREKTKDGSYKTFASVIADRVEFMEPRQPKVTKQDSEEKTEDDNMPF